MLTTFPITHSLQELTYCGISEIENRCKLCVSNSDINCQSILMKLFKRSGLILSKHVESNSLNSTACTTHLKCLLQGLRENSKCELNTPSICEILSELDSLKELRVPLKDTQEYNYECVICLFSTIFAFSRSETNVSSINKNLAMKNFTEILEKFFVNVMGLNMSRNSSDDVSRNENYIETQKSSSKKVNISELSVQEIMRNSRLNWSETDEKLFYKKLFPLIIFNFVLVLVSFVLNGALLFIFILNKQLCTDSNLMNLNLTIAHTIFLISDAIFSLVPSIWELFFVSPIPGLIWNAVICASVYSASALSIERYVAVVRLTRFYTTRRGSRTRYGLSVICIVWILSVLISVPPTALNPYNNFRILSIYYFIFQFVIPMITIAVFTALTSRYLKRSILTIPGETAANEAIKRSRAKTATILVIICVIFCFSYMPSYLVMLLSSVFEIMSDECFMYVAYVTCSFFFVNICFNPISMYILSQTFRGYFDRYLFCCRCVRYPIKRKSSSISAGEEDVLIN